ncbi:hypothetical protein STTU_1495 [Streptomyces sp. Tu6071]|nr:hypothetical protein STTU_1495 [Streptomyces sp. Tu6071]
MPGQGSDVDAVAAQVGERVHVGAVLGARAGLEVQVGTRDVARGARDRDLLTRGHGLPDRDGGGGQVPVLRVRPVVHTEHDLVPVRAAPVDLHDRPGPDRVDARAARRVEVDAGVAA